MSYVHPECGPTIHDIDGQFFWKPQPRFRRRVPVFTAITHGTCHAKAHGKQPKRHLASKQADAMLK